MITYLKGLEENDNLNPRQLTLKTVMLLALTRPSRSADLSSLHIQWRSYHTEGVTFRPTHLAKQCRSSKQRADFIFPLFQEDPRVCSVKTLKAHEDCTKEFRKLESPTPKTRLFLSCIGEHNPVASCSIAK